MWLCTEKRLSAGLLLATLLAGMFAVAIIGPDLVNPSNTTWIVGDFVQVQHAWASYRLDSSLAWSMTTNRLSWPLPIHIAMFDVLPLIALPLKLASAWLPTEFQYFGVVFVINVAFQAAFAFAMAAEVAARRMRSWTLVTFCFLVGMLFVMAPFFLHRFFLTHCALGTHWPILAALWLYVRVARVSFLTTTLQFAVLATIAGGINPYIALMVVCTYGGAILQLALQRNLPSARNSAILLLPVGAALVSMIAFGFLSVFGDGVVPGDGYGYYSANVLAPINPLGLPSAMLPSWPIATEGQSEGYGYLGAGSLLLVITGSIMALWNRTLISTQTLPLWLVAGLGLMLALSTKVTIGPHVVLSFKLPYALAPLMHFRASGRFIWLFDYTVLLLGFSFIAKIFRPNIATAAVALCVCLQIVDLIPTVRYLREKAAAFASVRFSDPSFNDLGKHHNLLLMTPSWYCGIYQPGYPSESYWPIAKLVLEQELKTNNFYSGRLPRVHQRYHCAEYLSKFHDSRPERTVAYMFTPRSFKRYGANVRNTHLCDFADGLVICRGDRGETGLSERLKRRLSDSTD